MGGAGGERGRLELWWWADNAFILAATVREALGLFAELTVALRAAGLRWKPSSLELCIGGDPRSAEVGVKIGDLTYEVDGH